ncbi:hypothetical protein [Actinoplanes sp. NPDC049265]|uniref:hypothetical protein n=1 Tax=Actinoplanes sp. NPDC049265 TaxID=3363902 RepID=UPI00371FCFCB
MSTSAVTRSMHELCADSRTIPWLDGTHLNTDSKVGVTADQYIDGVQADRPMPHIATLIYRQEMAGSSLTTGFQNRIPAEVRDKMGVRPTAPEGLDIVALAGLADTVRHFVQVPKGRLTPPPADQLPDAHDRVSPLDEKGLTTTWDQASWIRVHPADSATGHAWSDVPEAVAHMMKQSLAGRPYLGGRIVIGPHGVQLGLPAGLVNAWYGDLASSFGRHLNNDDIAAARAAVESRGLGPMRASVVPGFVELERLLEQSPDGTQALVKVDDGDDRPYVFLADKSDSKVTFLDLGPGPSAAVYPLSHSSIEVNIYPDRMSLPDRIESMRDAGRVTTEPSGPILWPEGSGYYRPEGTKGPGVVVIGPIEHEPAVFLDGLAKNAAELAQPIFVLGAGRDGRDVPPESRVQQMRSLLSQFGWNDKVPVVVTRAQLKGGPRDQTLYDGLDFFNASLVHQVPGKLSLDNVWTVRSKGGSTTGRPTSAQLDLPLLTYAAGEDRRPAHPKPPAEIMPLLTKPVREWSIDLFSPEARTLGALVKPFARPDPQLSGHVAALDLVAKGEAGTVTSFVEDPGNGLEALARPLRTVGGDTPAERKQSLRTLLPLLAELAGGYGMTDAASHGVLLALNAKLAGTAGDDEIRAMIWDRKDHLPDRVRPDLVRLVADLAHLVPEADAPGYEQVGEWILTCPPARTG